MSSKSPLPPSKGQLAGARSSTNQNTIHSCTTKHHLTGGGFSTKEQSAHVRSVLSTYTRPSLESVIEPHKSLVDIKESSRKSRADCDISESTSHTQFFKKPRHEELYARITTDEFFGISASVSGSSDTFRCVHGSKGKVYSKKSQLKRNIMKELDPIPNEPKWTQKCKSAYGWNIVEVLKFLVQDPTVEQQKERLLVHLSEFVKLSKDGFIINHLENICIITSYLIESLPKNPNRKDIIMLFLENMINPILMHNVVDAIKFNDQLINYMGFLGYLLMRLEDNSMFDLVSKAIIWHLSTPDKLRVDSAVKISRTLNAAGPMLFEIATRMLAITSSHRFPTFQKIALLLACHSEQNCIELMKLNIIENLFYRFNPYFPHRRLPVYDVNPDDPQDINVKLGSICNWYISIYRAIRKGYVKPKRADDIPTTLSRK